MTTTTGNGQSQEKTYELLPEDRYKAKAVEVQITSTKAKEGEQHGKPRVAVLFELVEAGALTGKRITWFGNMTGKTEYAVKVLTVLGWNPQTPVRKTPLGKVVHVTVKHDTYNGKARANVAFVNALDDTGPGLSKFKLADAEAEMAEKAFMATASANAGAGGTDGTRVESPSQQGDDDDSIPF